MISLISILKRSTSRSGIIFDVLKIIAYIFRNQSKVRSKKKSDIPTRRMNLASFFSAVKLSFAASSVNWKPNEVGDRRGNVSSTQLAPLTKTSLYTRSTYAITLVLSELSQFRPVRAKCGRSCVSPLSRVSVRTSCPAREG